MVSDKKTQQEHLENGAMVAVEKKPRGFGSGRAPTQPLPSSTLICYNFAVYLILRFIY